MLSLLPVPVVLGAAAFASVRTAEQVGARAATVLGFVAELVRMPPSLAEHDELVVIPTDTPAPPAPVAAPEKRVQKAGKHVKPSGPPVVFVSRNAVLGLASSGARPHGAPVPATAVRPAGLRLAGVGALGIGLRDGDVLTRALGQPALSTGAVIHAVLAARARHAPVLEGEFWRGDQRWVIRVEQPYLDERRSDANERDGQGSVTASGAESG